MGPTLIGLLQESVVKYSSLAALKHGSPEGGLRTVTYAELYAAVKELGTGLIAIGLAPGDARGHPLGEQPALADRRPGHPRVRRAWTCPSARA